MIVICEEHETNKARFVQAKLFAQVLATVNHETGMLRLHKNAYGQLFDFHVSQLLRFINHPAIIPKDYRHV